jgi:hypothetical protein
MCTADKASLKKGIKKVRKNKIKWKIINKNISIEKYKLQINK